jgi:hypothetical protein
MWKSRSETVKTCSNRFKNSTPLKGLGLRIILRCGTRSSDQYSQRTSCFALVLVLVLVLVLSKCAEISEKAVNGGEDVTWSPNGLHPLESYRPRDSENLVFMFLSLFSCCQILSLTFYFAPKGKSPPEDKSTPRSPAGVSLHLQCRTNRALKSGTLS